MLIPQFEYFGALIAFCQTSVQSSLLLSMPQLSNSISPFKSTLTLPEPDTVIFPTLTQTVKN